MSVRTGDSFSTFVCDGTDDVLGVLEVAARVVAGEMATSIKEINAVPTL
jgi:hypothetical protein